jgi:hypothetical protein
MTSILSKLPDRLLKSAFKWGGEFAWARDDAADVIKWAEAQNYAVIGVEVWLPSPDGPIIPSRYVYVWSLSRSKRNSSGPKDALEYVQSFDWDPDDAGFLDSKPFFNLTLDRD